MPRLRLLKLHELIRSLSISNCSSRIPGIEILCGLASGMLLSRNMVRSAVGPTILAFETAGGTGAGGGGGRAGPTGLDGNGSLLHETINNIQAHTNKKVLVSFFMI